MKDFLKQCLEELELKTGIRQIYWLNQQCENQTEFDKKKNILLDAMLLSCKEFSYIPEAAQKAIISSQMIQDQDYEALNSRIIWKWLNAFKGPYLNPKELQDKEVVFEEIPASTWKMVEDFKKSLLDFGDAHLSNTAVESEMKAIEREDKRKVEKPVSLSTHYKPKEKDPREEKIREYIIKTKGADYMGKMNFEMDGLKFRCDSEADGYDTFVNALRDENP